MHAELLTLTKDHISMKITQFMCLKLVIFCSISFKITGCLHFTMHKHKHCNQLAARAFLFTVIGRRPPMHLIIQGQ